jgi:hypothetical protein
MKKIVFIGAFILLACNVSAQDYYTAVGVRAGLTNGFTIKHFITRVDAVEGILIFRKGGFRITGLYEFENEFYFDFDTTGFKWYYGFGVHFGYFKGSRDDTIGSFDDNHPGSVTIIGADGIVGIEYTFRNSPINLSLDWQPVFNLIGNTGWSSDTAALSIRYTFK